MNYLFITKLHNMSLDTIYAKGKIISGGTRISNGSENFKKHFDNRFFRGEIGEIEYREFKNSVYMYDKGEIEGLKDNLNPSSYYFNFLDSLLRKAQHFANCLWLTKDNTVHVRTGYLYLYENNPYTGAIVISCSLNLVPSTASCEYDKTSFSTEEIEKAISYYNYDPVENWDEGEEGLQMPDKNPLTKDKGRIDRAKYFLLITRSSTSLPIKIMNYCSILECLLTSDNSGLSHKVSERFAYYLGNNYTERSKYFKLAKSAYDIRSKTVHGQPIKKTKEEMQEIAIEIDAAVRKIFASVLNEESDCNIFNMKNEDYESWFTELILK
ncbi:HEPN domain-containing protein [Bacillus cereus group sp. BY9-3LC]|uniref:HEPN domain-containing protein n=1 Tax=unclassified Bacillus cereus group TaxID=2750818 RepID=UPI001F590AE8|nr:HEPN domain-containing protein [Bacillus cereus group sp. BY9-3LC]MDA1777170.1 HEPN domain-containing protein [Bacillus cereus group sp. BY9-3LC]